MEYDIYKSAYCEIKAFAHDPIGGRQYFWGNVVWNKTNINDIFRKAQNYNTIRERECSCRVEVKEVV